MIFRPFHQATRLGALFLAALPLGTVADSISNLVVDNPGGYVLASDALGGPEYDRDAVQVTFAYRADSPALFQNTSALYRFTYQLRDAEGNIQLLNTADGAAGQIQELHTIHFSSSSFFSTVQLDPRLEPFEKLDPYTSYTVHVSAERSMDDGATFSPRASNSRSGVRLFHFTNLDPDQEGVHVIAEVHSTEITAASIADTVTDFSEYQAQVLFNLKRWDQFGSSHASDSVTVHFDLTLRRADNGQPVPLESSRVTHTFQVDRYREGSWPREPSNENFSTKIAFRPAGQLNSVAANHRLSVEISHIEIGGEPPVQGNSATSPGTRLLHFNGKLFFGDIETTFDDLLSRPAVFGIEPTYVGSRLPIPEGRGSLPGVDDFSFGTGDALPVRLLANGDAVFSGSGAVELKAAEDYQPWLIGGQRVSHGPVALTESGATSLQFTVFLPAGSSLVPTAGIQMRLGLPFLPFEDVALGQDLLPVENELWAPLQDPYLNVESLPLLFTVWQVGLLIDQEELRFYTSGVRFSAEDRYAYLEDPIGGLTNQSARQRYSNDTYFRFVDEVENFELALRSGKRGEALVTTSFSLSAGAHTPHFPFGSQVQWEYASYIHVVDSRIDVETSFLEGVTGVFQIYDAGCPEGDCGSAAQQTEWRAIRADGDLGRFTAEGGIHITGEIHTNSPAADLVWGKTSSTTWTHRTETFARAHFYAPGNVLGGEAVPSEADKAPGTLLLSGVNSGEFTQAERPGEAAYRKGYGDYAGLNFRVEETPGYSILGGETFGFALSERSKYYIRASGVNGIHEAVGFEETRTIYNYPFAFSNFGLSFLSGSNHESRLNGQVEVPYPSDFVQEFENLTLTCSGALDNAQPPEGDRDKTLAYWEAVFSTYAIQFAPDPSQPCNPSAGYLGLALGTEPASLATRLYGTIGFLPEGDIITPADDAGFVSRLTAPQSLRVAGPPDETYTLDPVADLYFNSHRLRDESASPKPSGFLSLAAGMGVPFFSQLPAQLHLSPSPSLGDEEKDFRASLYYVMGGWPSEGWTDSDDRHFFNFTLFDQDHRGYPAGESLAFYRNPTREDDTHEQYLVRARKEWLKVIHFDYPLQWNPVNRAFRSPRTIERDLLVMEVQHQVRYLSSRHAEISFGAQYDGLPEINVSNMLFNAVDEHLGAAESLVKSAGDQIFSEILGGVDGFARLLDDKVQDIFRALFDEGIDPLLEQAAHVANAQLRNFNGTLDDWDALIDQVRADTQNLRQDIKDEISNITGSTQQITEAPVNLIGHLDAELAKVQRSIQALRPEPLVIDGEVVEGLLARGPDGQGREILERLVKELTGEAIAGLVTSVIEEPLAELMERAEPTLQQVEHFLIQIDDKLQQVRDRLQETGGQVGDFAAEIQQRIAGAESEINSIVDQVFDETLAYLERVPRTDFRFEEISGEQVEELQAFLRQTFEDVFFSSDIIRQYHRIVRQRIYDVYLTKQEVVDNIFAQVNETVRGVIAETVGAAEEQLNELLGELGEKIGAGEITGFAHIQGDALRLLRIDALFQFKVPDEMELKAYLQIKQLRADGFEGCSIVAEERAVETTIGALDVPLGWMSPGLRANIETRFSLDTSGSRPKPTGLAGAFAITDGVIGFESFKIYQLAAAMAFSGGGGEVNEAYLSAALGMEFGDYDVMGGIFFGRACSLAPIEIWDTDVAAVLGSPPFTGAYVYGQGWIPVSEAVLGIPASCMFNISAGVGAGAFFFVEEPTFGGKLFAGLSGDVLCIATVRGEMTLVGAKEGTGAGGLRLLGNGFVSGKVGAGPLSYTLRRDVAASYLDGSWDLNFR